MKRFWFARGAPRGPRLARMAGMAAAAGLLLGACGRRASPPETPFLIGICHVTSSADLALARELGVDSVRNTMQWQEIDPGSFRMPERQRFLEMQARRDGLGLLTPIAYGNSRFDGGGYPVSEEAVANYSRSAAFAALGWRNPQPIFEIWNEWNLGIGMKERRPGSPRDYVRLQAAAYAAIKAVRNPPTVLGGSMAGAGLTDDWLAKACDEGLLDHLDGLSFHPYCYWMRGRKAMPERGMMGLIRSLEKIVDRREGGRTVPLYLTEIGWPTYDEADGVTLEEQAQYAARMLLLARSNPRIKGVWWFNLRDSNSMAHDFDSRFGLVFSSGTPKPAFFSFRDTTRFLHEVKSAWHESAGETVHAVWTDFGGGRKGVALWISRPGAMARIRVDARTRGGCSIQLAGTGEELPVEPDANGLTLIVGNMPVFIRGLGEGASIQWSEVVERE